VRLPNTIETFSGKEFDYRNPVIVLEDVAHGLSNTCRFQGHTSSFYSVAEHSVLVAAMVSWMVPELTLTALWHDAHEAYLGDLATPLKAIVGDEYKAIAGKIDEAVCWFLGLDPSTSSFRHPAIKLADELAVMYEASKLKPGPGWEFTRGMSHRGAQEVVTWPLGLPPEMAELLFIDMHRALSSNQLALGDMNPAYA